MYKRFCVDSLGISRSLEATEPNQNLKMKLMIVAALALVAAVVAAPPNAPAGSSHVVQILRSEFDNNPDGSYAFNFETEDGNKRQENGEVREVVDEENKPQKVVVVRGSYSYTNPEGKPELINYYADETGYHAEGDSVPKPARK